ncbi:MAG: hypothetical protein EOO36_22090, partial [Cytophagaceae bacterium]
YQAVDARTAQVPDSSARTAAGLARYIVASFAGEADRARAAFVWVARHIRYDMANQFLLEYEREPAVVVQETLDQRRGVCRHYAELYSAVANQAGVLTYVVPGYSSLRDAVGHAWCASRIDGQWQLLDPTWAAGRVVNNQFVFQLNNEYFRMSPRQAIEVHMPFDPLWQLLPAPRTPEQFQGGRVPPTPQPAFAVADSVALYTQQTMTQRLHAANRRIAQNGVRNGLIYTYLANNRTREENLHIGTFNEALQEYNQGAGQLNAFVEYFNHQFLPRKTDDELRELLPPIAAHFNHARQLLAAVHAQPTTHVPTQDLRISLQQVDNKLANCQSFMSRYLNTGKLLRPLLFKNISNLGGNHEMTR